MSHKTGILAVALVLVSMGKLSWGQTAESREITGTVVYLQRMALPPNAVVTVQLQDVSMQDVPAKVIADVKIATEGKQVPIPFRIPYTSAEINPTHDYAVRATIMTEAIMMSSTASYPVITRGAPTQIEVVVQPVLSANASTPPEAKPRLQISAPTRFSGDLPCADCAGIEFTLTLRPDGTFLSRAKYRGREGKAVEDLGRWSLQGNGTRLVLRTGQRAPQQFAVKDSETLRQLDIKGREIVSELNYDLKRAQDATTQLEGTDWTLIELGSTLAADGAGANRATLVLIADGKRLSGSSGCNRVVGTYELEKDVLQFKPVGMTMMACLDPLMLQEHAFIEALKSTSTYRIVDATLELSDGGRVLARFESEAR